MKNEIPYAKKTFQLPPINLRYYFYFEILSASPF